MKTLRVHVVARIVKSESESERSTRTLWSTAGRLTCDCARLGGAEPPHAGNQSAAWSLVVAPFVSPLLRHGDDEEVACSCAAPDCVCVCRCAAQATTIESVCLIWQFRMSDQPSRSKSRLDARFFPKQRDAAGIGEGRQGFRLLLVSCVEVSKTRLECEGRDRVRMKSEQLRLTVERALGERGERNSSEFTHSTRTRSIARNAQLTTK